VSAAGRRFLSAHPALRRRKSALRRKALGNAGNAAYIHLNASNGAPVQQEPIMSDNILSAVLTFGLMAAGTAAIGTEMLNGHRAATPTECVTLAPVMVTGHRASTHADAVTLPAVMIIGHRQARAEVAAETHDDSVKVE
jgi:hypothetical protein